MNIEILDVSNVKEEKDKKDLYQYKNTKSTFGDRGIVLFGRDPYGRDPLGPKKYVCPNCGIIPGSDLFWKTEENIRKPYCIKCKVHVKLEENAK